MLNRDFPQVFINGLGLVSAQNTWQENKVPMLVKEHHGSYLKVAEPEYSTYIDARAARRMGRILKVGYFAARRCIDDAAKSPDAILTGTGLGIVEDTEKFLHSILDSNEQFVNPTPFIQSTHNTIGGQIAMHLKCHGYNHTYVQKGLSFESAVLDAFLLVSEHPESNILCGGFDENSDEHFRVTRRVGLWKETDINTSDLLNATTPGTIWGEGAGFFMLSGKPASNSYARLAGLTTWYTSGDIDFGERVSQFLASAGRTISDIDMLITGRNGDGRYDGLYQKAEASFPQTCHGAYKHLSGDFYTSVVFAYWLAALMIKSGEVPATVITKGGLKDKPSAILIYNHWFGKYHSLALLSAI